MLVYKTYDNITFTYIAYKKCKITHNMGNLPLGKYNQNICLFCIKGDQRLYVVTKITKVKCVNKFLEVKETEERISSLVNFTCCGNFRISLTITHT